MANPTCTAAVLVNNAATFRRNIVNQKQQRCLMLQAKLIELAAIGGTNYTANHNQLAIDASGVEVGTTPDEREAARISLAYTFAAAVGGTVSSNINTLLQNLTGLVNRDDNLLDLMDLYVTCQLGVHKTRPQ